MPKTYMVLFCKGERVGSFELTDENKKELHHAFVMSLIQKDIGGTEHYNIIGIKKIK